MLLNGWGQAKRWAENKKRVVIYPHRVLKLKVLKWLIINQLYKNKLGIKPYRFLLN